MRVLIGSDRRTSLTDHVVEQVRNRAESVVVCGALADEKDMLWPVVAQHVAEQVSRGVFDHGILFCWSGTGAAIAANKVVGARAALCSDAKTAKMARAWNHANVLVLSLRLTADAVSDEIIDVWFSTPWDQGEFTSRALALLQEFEREQSTRPSP